MKKILFLGDINSSHLIKWATSLAGEGFEIGIFSLNKSVFEWYKSYENIHVFNEVQRDDNFFKSSVFNKLEYLLYTHKVKKTIRDFKPDILHAHYATSYGLIGRLSGFKPYIVSVWGSDIFDFPHISIIAKKLIQRNLRYPEMVMSTSHVMKKEILKYVDRKVEITPFGVDMKLFTPKQVKRITGENDIVIGAIKQIEKKYGTDVLIAAFKKVCTNNPDKNLKLLLVGSGTMKEECQELARKLGIEDKVIFAGKVTPDKVPDYHNMIDIYCNISILDSESFGVSVVEAMACGKPVIVTNVGGLPEVVSHNETGIIIEKENPDAAAEAIQRLIDDEKLVEYLTKNAMKHVHQQYNWDNNLQHIIQLYSKYIGVPQ
ncbi:MAG TPA: glycosyltransferase [Bacteroidia bacterium]|nr:glycosyltransferase [Bacteroidia bacterium]